MSASSQTCHACTALDLPRLCCFAVFQSTCTTPTFRSSLHQFKPTFSLLSSQYSLFSPLPIQYHPYRPSSLFSLSCTASLTFWLEQQNGTLLITFPAAHGGTVLGYRIRRQARACTHLCKPHEYSLHTCVNLIKCSNSLYTHDPEHSQSELKGGPEAAGRP